MSVNLDNWVLPVEASRVDRMTLCLWRFWEGWLRGALALARVVAIALVVLASVAWFLFDGWSFGIVGVGVAGAIVLGVAGGIRAAGISGLVKRQGSIGQIVVAMVVGIPMGFLLLSFGVFGAVLVMSLVVAPVMNYPVLVVVVVPAAFGVGHLIQRFRKRNDSRYPQPVES